VSIIGRIQTRQWEDAEKKRHWKTEIVANSVEMLSGKKKKDYAAESAAHALEAQAAALGMADSEAFSASADDEESDEAEEEALAA
jgi:single-stranded DNA-binding protein